MSYIITKEGVSLMGTRGVWVLTQSNNWSPTMDNAAIYSSRLAAGAAAKVMKALNFGAKIRVQKI